MARKKRDQGLIAKPQYLIEIVGRRFPVTDMVHASRLVSEIRDRSGAGSSGMGSFFPVYEDGKYIAYVSYNGKVWRGHPDNWKSNELMYDPFSHEAG